MCESCFKPDGGTCGCDPCLVNQGSNWCTVCAHHGSGPGVPAVAGDAAYDGGDGGDGWGGEQAEGETESY